jgi:hypothetical protein
VFRILQGRGHETVITLANAAEYRSQMAFRRGRVSLVVAVQFHQSDGGLQVGHVALPTGEGHIVPPRAGLSLGQGILALAVQAHGVEEGIELFMIEGLRVGGRRAHPPSAVVRFFTAWKLNPVISA